MLASTLHFLQWGFERLFFLCNKRNTFEMIFKIFYFILALCSFLALLLLGALPDTLPPGDWLWYMS